MLFASLRRRRADGHLLRALLELIDVAAVTCAADGRLTHVNSAARDLVGRRCEPGSYPESWMRALQPRTASGVPLVLADLPVMRALEGEVVRGVDMLIRVAGADVLLESDAQPARDESGRSRGAIMTMREVTKERRREALLRSRLLSRERRDFEPPRLGELE